MEGISVTEEAFDRRALELPPLEEESLPAERMVSLTLEFEPWCAYRVYDEFDRKLITPGEDGRLRAVSYTHLDVYKRQPLRSRPSKR